MLLRLLRRKVSLECKTPQEFVEAEFKTNEGQYDLSLSVFEVEDLTEIVVRTKAETTAGNNLDPKPRASVDVEGTATWKIETTPTINGLMDFRFSSQAHRELKITSETDLKELATHLLGDLTGRKKEASKDQVCEYGYQRYIDLDDEWVKVCSLSEKVRGWVMKGKK